MDVEIIKKHNIFVSTTFIKNGNKISKAIDLLKKNKIFNIELGSNHLYERNYNYIKKNKKFNYLTHNYFPIPKNSFVINIASLDPSIRKMSLQHIKKSILFCKKINAKLYTFHPGFLSDPDGEGSGKNKNYDFKWKNIRTKKHYKLAWKYMVNSIKKIILISKKHKIKIAIETEGSFNASEHLLMQRPSEYLKFKKIFKKKDIGINLNLGHLNLASKKFKFDKHNFVNIVSDYIYAFECSHNSGINDDHLPLKKNFWYWKILKNKKYIDKFKILEFRNTNINEITKNIKLFK
tara:strand:+ start:5230 stop:6105 length:876 start_codon:yes stop_codon:yes gene_type:complete